MELGKLSIKELEELIFKNIAKRRKEVLNKPAIGSDCAEIEVGDNIIYLSSDPITGASSSIGKLAVHINCNDIATTASEPLGLMITLLAPPSTQKEEIIAIMKEFEEECSKLNIDILGGHTEITSAVTRTLVSCTVVSLGKKAEKLSYQVKDGDDIIITKGVGIEGIAILAHEKEEELREKFGEDFVAEAKNKFNLLSVLKESKLAKAYAKAMHDATEGGLLGALWELAELYSLGIKIYEDKIFVDEVTEKISAHFNINPLRLISSGTMLIVVDNKDSEKLLNILKENNIAAWHIGNFTEARDKILLRADGQEFEIEEPSTDELFKVIFKE